MSTSPLSASSHVDDPEVEERSGKGCIGLPFGEHVIKVAHFSRAARSDDGDIDGLCSGARQLQVISFLGAVAVHAREEHFARA